MRNPRLLTVIFVLSLQISSAAQTQPSRKVEKRETDRVIAIDVLFELDEKMIGKSEAANARLRSNYREGFTLGRKHVPHLTLLQRYVYEDNLPAIGKAITPILQAEKPTAMPLTATGYGYALWGGLAITNIRVEELPDLSRLQKQIEKAVEPFAVHGGTAAAFATSHELRKIDKEIINYVEKFVPESSGDKFSPHVTIGLAHEDFIKHLRAAPFQEFVFKPDGVAIYQLGNFGTAQKKLWEWNRQTRSKR
jgi:2'-5' RNA ligase